MKQHLHIYLLILLSACLGTSYGQIYSYTSDSSGAYATILTNATGVKLTRYNGATLPSSPCASGFSITTFSTSATTYFNTLPAIEADAKANSGYQLNVTGFSVGLRRSNSGPAKARLAYSTDGGTTWIDKGSDDAPNNGTCGAMTTATWTVALTVSSSNTLKFRVYFFNAANAQGLAQVMNMNINGTVTSTSAGPADSVFTTATSFGPFCGNKNDTILVPFTKTGTSTGPFLVQLSNAAGVFPSNTTSSLISTGTATSPATAIIPSGTAGGTGYRVRVVNQNTAYISGDNGSNIVINATQSTTLYDTLCPGRSILFAGNTQTASGTYIDLQSTVTGCDSTITLYLTVLPTLRDTIFASVCQGASLPFHGTTYSLAGSYSDTVRCDSIVTLVLSYKTVQRDTVNAVVCQGSSYPFHGTTYTTAGAYSDTVRCDSIVTLVLSYLPVHRDTVTARICQGSTYSFGGTSYTLAGAYSDTVRCDSISTLVLTYKPVLRDTLHAIVCQGNSYPFHGTTYTLAGAYSDTVRCDSIVTLLLSYTPVLRDTITASICRGGSYPFHGTSYTLPGAYSDTIRCDSIVTLILSIKTVLRDTLHASICQGDSFTFHGTAYHTPGAYSDTVRCDSIVTLVLSIKTVHRDTIHASICQGGNYPFHGTSYTTAGTYSDTVRCDSISILALTIKPVLRDTVRAGICQGDSYPFHGVSYTASGTHSDTVRCDSIVTLVLTVHPKPVAVATLTGNTHLSTTVYSSYQWLLNGNIITNATSQNYTATQNGSYSVIVTDANGCKDTSNAVTVTTIGIIEANQLNARIYPSPTEGVIYIDAEGLNSVQIIDMVGRQVMAMTINKANPQTQVDLTGYADGMYTMILRGADNAISIKNIIKK